MRPTGEIEEIVCLALRKKKKIKNRSSLEAAATIRIDLHCHSTCSDGSLSAKDVARRARSCGVELFCLTDHDTVAGYTQTIDAFSPGHSLCGVELTCSFEARTVHLLVYGVDYKAASGPIQQILLENQVKRCLRVLKIVEKLGNLGIQLDSHSILEQAKHRTPGRPDVARAMVENRTCHSVQEAFTRYLRDGGPADVSTSYPELASILSVGNDLGLKMSLAHPQVYKEPEFVQKMFEKFRFRGLEGLETFNCSHTWGKRKLWCDLANAVDAVMTAGSDYHGTDKPRIMNPGVDFPRDLLGRLSEWLDVRNFAC